MDFASVNVPPCRSFTVHLSAAASGRAATVAASASAAARPATATASRRVRELAPVALRPLFLCIWTPSLVAGRRRAGIEGAGRRRGEYLALDRKRQSLPETIRAVHHDPARVRSLRNE